MRYFISITIIFLISCQTQTKYPEGGFDYPKNISSDDTNFYYYPLKDIESKEDAFQDEYAYLFYEPFDEPNLSIKPQSKETFRLTYSTAFGNSVIITFTEDQMIVKKGNPSILYFEDTSRLTKTEKFHLSLLKRRFPIETKGKNPFMKKYLDSLTKQYPQLLDPNYYHKLYEKTLSRSSKLFSYPITKISLTKHEFNSIIQLINSSGFWGMNYKVELECTPADGYGFTLEANTKNKYKIVSAVGCPNDTTKFTKACQKIIEIAKMDKEINLIWSIKTITVKPDNLNKIKE